MTVITTLKCGYAGSPQGMNLHIKLKENELSLLNNVREALPDTTKKHSVITSLRLFGLVLDILKRR